MRRPGEPRTALFDSPAYVDATDVRGVGLSPRDPSELDAQACGRGDILGRLEAVREPAVDIRNHQAGVEVDAPEGTIVDQSGKCVLCSGAFVAADAVDRELVAVGLDNPPHIPPRPARQPIVPGLPPRSTRRIPPLLRRPSLGIRARNITGRSNCSHRKARFQPRTLSTTNPINCLTRLPRSSPRCCILATPAVAASDISPGSANRSVNSGVRSTVGPTRIELAKRKVNRRAVTDKL
jgi:hypothetical protein